MRLYVGSPMAQIGGRVAAGRVQISQNNASTIAVKHSQLLSRSGGAAARARYGAAFA